MKNRLDLLIIGSLLIVFAGLFFYRLNFSTLASYDEAWYGAIAREVLRGHTAILHYNGGPYVDHPPMGFYLMALSFLTFGLNEFSARFSSAIIGLLSIILIYLIGQKLFNRAVGLSAALILGSCVWYVLRVRSGNLDAPFLGFYLLTIFLGLKAQKNPHWLIPTAASTALLMLTKTLVGASIFPLLIYLEFDHLKNYRQSRKFLLAGFGLFLLIVSPWYLLNTYHSPEFLRQHFFGIGLRQRDFLSFFSFHLQPASFYLHMGITKWYKLFLLSFGLLSLDLIKKNKSSWFLLLWFGLIAYPFFTTTQTAIWHLIPLYAPMALITARGLQILAELTHEIIYRLGKIHLLIILISAVAPVLMVTIIFIMIWRQIWPQIIPTNKFIPNDVAISLQAQKYQGQIYLKELFLPVAVFYSDRPINYIGLNLDSYHDMIKILQTSSQPSNRPLIMVANSQLDNLKRDQIDFQILEQNQEFSLIAQK